uniref:Uncharacterized protein n=1 Tax=Ananas comosus var. bracteatus TaxID=296719 RepID=A0A6V7Q5K5_ANACO|nr:unnamed protein product [Ananas comosus var. bracteatus]
MELPNTPFARDAAPFSPLLPPDVRCLIENEAKFAATVAAINFYTFCHDLWTLRRAVLFLRKSDSGSYLSDDDISRQQVVNFYTFCHELQTLNDSSVADSVYLFRHVKQKDWKNLVHKYFMQDLLEESDSGSDLSDDDISRQQAVNFYTFCHELQTLNDSSVADSVYLFRHVKQKDWKNLTPNDSLVADSVYSFSHVNQSENK